ncbi:uncharacterized protein UV8b_07959 [Ustilaginoidea virens]|uniref:RanGTP-binding protein n=1 Tax=Ustilaginoidea virens TaxID=1159556 RepID=A0A8E5MKJ1_USTVR|nr:uncharacterized protein UV8b_07959 [Ustilaginoidea virens]QUC23718.1 hypothetical protein UV8b_07959 [Ustilaginoidea virens]
MDQFLSFIGVQAVKYAIRSGIVLTSNYALNQCSRLISTLDDRDLEGELKEYRGLLESHLKVKTLGRVFEDVALVAESVNSGGKDNQKKSESKDAEHGIRHVIEETKSLLDRIVRDLPLLQLAITASGESLSTSIPSTISPSRLLQASTFIAMGDWEYAQCPRTVQIGPAFSLSLYMLFIAHAPVGSIKGSNPCRADAYGLGENDRKPIWQEVIHKAYVRLYRYTTTEDGDQMCSCKTGVTSPCICERKGYRYKLEIQEDLNDGRLHCDNDETNPSAGDNLSQCECIRVAEICKLFYTDKAKLLNIGDASGEDVRPILLLKRDVERSQQTTLGEDSVDSFAGYKTEGRRRNKPSEDYDLNDRHVPQSFLSTSASHDTKKLRFLSDLPKHLDPEWLAFEMFAEASDVDSAVGGEDNGEDENLENSEHVDTSRFKNIVGGIDRSEDASDHASTLDSIISSKMGLVSVNSSTHNGQSAENEAMLSGLQGFKNISKDLTFLYQIIF